MTFRRRWWLIDTLVAAMILWPSISRAVAPAGTHKIEQDWRVELYTVSDPDKTTCPLFVTAFALNQTYFQVTWNHRDLPDLEQGGIQLQSYAYNDLLEAEDVVTPPWRDKLSTDGEIVTWTQGVHKNDSENVFTVKDIVGTTWGTIAEAYSVKVTYYRWALIWDPAQGIYLKWRLVPADAPTFEGWDVNNIKENSAILMGTNRFKKLAITEIRFYDQNGELLETDEGEHVVFEQPSTYEYFVEKRLGE